MICTDNFSIYFISRRPIDFDDNSDDNRECIQKEKTLPIKFNRYLQFLLFHLAVCGCRP